jgi:hypothetical protein
VTVRMKLTLLMGALVCANLAIWGAKQMLGLAIDPILKVLGS